MLAALSTLRKRLGLNTRELAELTFINPSVIPKIENGKRSPTERQMALLERFGFHLEDYDEEGLAQDRQTKLRQQMVAWQTQMLAEAKVECLQAKRRYEAARKLWQAHDEQLHLLQFLAEQWEDLGGLKKELIKSAAFKKKWSYKGPTAEKVARLKLDWTLCMRKVEEIETNGTNL